MNGPGSSIKVIEPSAEADDRNAGNRHTRRSQASERWGETPVPPHPTFPILLEVPEWPDLPSSPRANAQHTMHAHTESDDERGRT